MPHCAGRPAGRPGWRAAIALAGLRASGSAGPGVQHLLGHLGEHGRERIYLDAEVGVEGAVPRPASSAMSVTRAATNPWRSKTCRATATSAVRFRAASARGPVGLTHLGRGRLPGRRSDRSARPGRDPWLRTPADTSTLRWTWPRGDKSGCREPACTVSTSTTTRCWRTSMEPAHPHACNGRNHGRGVPWRVSRVPGCAESTA